MLLVLILCLHVCSLITVSADSLIVDKRIDEFKTNSDYTDNKRIAELEEQVAYLQEIIGVRNLGTFTSFRGFDSFLNPTSRGKCFFVFKKNWY